MSKQHDKEIQKRMCELFETGKSASAIARELGLYTTSVTRVLKRHGYRMTDGKGQNHSQWKGGRGKKCGYWTVYAPDHPRALNNRRVWEHILILEKHLGRHISKKEPIHHVDLDRANNDLTNLYLCSSNTGHQRVHKSLDKVVSQLIKNETIKFKDGRYYLP